MSCLGPICDGERSEGVSFHMRPTRQTISFLAVFSLLTGFRCGDITNADCPGFEATSAENICVSGTVHHYPIEGGFWAVRGDDNTTYDPLGALPESFRVEGLRVRLEARIRSDAVSFHMVGPIVEILDIRRL